MNQGSRHLRRIGIAHSLACLVIVGLGASAIGQSPPTDFSFLPAVEETGPKSDYQWTTDHMHVGVRWQPSAGRPKANAYDATRPVIARDSSYVQFWANWAAIEPTIVHQDYVHHPAPGLQAIDAAVDFCHANGIKVELVFFHCPGWASESGKSGGFKPKTGLFKGYASRMARHFKGRVDAYQTSHEANLEALMKGADTDFIIHEILIEGAQAIRDVYSEQPSEPVIVSTTGMSPCQGCATAQGLDGTGGHAVNQLYDLFVANPRLMNLVDALNMNMSDQNDGYGNMDGEYVPSVWGNYDLVRGKLDASPFRSRSILSAESWISWDSGRSAVDVNGDGVTNEQDAYHKAITIIGQCMQRGLNTINLPWSDNSSGWAMGLTKRLDYNGRIKNIKPEIVIPAANGGADVVTRKLTLRGADDSFTVHDGSGEIFTVEDYINPADPNHLHYYIWKWYAQIAAGPDEVIRHSIAGEIGNNIAVTGPGFTGNQRYRIAAYNRTRERFIVLVYSGGASGNSAAKVLIPAKIQSGVYYNNDASKVDFRGEGFAEGQVYKARVITKDIRIEDGSDANPVYFETNSAKVVGSRLSVDIPKLNKFTAIEFVKTEEVTQPGSP